ncbi:hypothetical protein V6N13_021813 [Hibiscus sabdariffa]
MQLSLSTPVNQTMLIHIRTRKLSSTLKSQPALVSFLQHAGVKNLLCFALRNETKKQAYSTSNHMTIHTIWLNTTVTAKIINHQVKSLSMNQHHKACLSSITKSQGLCIKVKI